jgi:hypothetical protein
LARALALDGGLLVLGPHHIAEFEQRHLVWREPGDGGVAVEGVARLVVQPRQERPD